MNRLERTQLVPRPLPEVFAFFGDAGNLEEITPAYLRFEILTPRPIHMGPGTLIDYRLALFGIRFEWRTRIEVFEPGVRFIDVQEKGPYRVWRHRHEFESVAGGTQVSDVVEYELPFGVFGSIAHALFVRRSVTRIFDFRRERIEELLGPGEVSR